MTTLWTRTILLFLFSYLYSLMYGEKKKRKKIDFVKIRTIRDDFFFFFDVGTYLKMIFSTKFRGEKINKSFAIELPKPRYDLIRRHRRISAQNNLKNYSSQEKTICLRLRTNLLKRFFFFFLTQPINHHAIAERIIIQNRFKRMYFSI